MACPSCAAEVPTGARFCPSCGHAVVSRGDERRVATVLFADLAGFTGLSEAMDPEQVKNLVDRCFARLAVDVTSHGGRVDKVVGDAIVALFGAPVAHEDDAERAVRAALQMQASIAAFRAELESSSRLPTSLALRVGVNSGEVLVGGLRAGGDYTAMGDVVNVASRLQTMAQPGSVVVGESTYHATSGVVRYEPLGDLEARGREGRVPAWRAIESLTPPGRRPRRTAAPIVGRDSELLLLRQALELSVRRSRPVVALVLGDAGMGKSRLTEEVAAEMASKHGALLLEGRCLPYGEANPWWPIAEAVRTACGVDADDSAETTREKVRAAVTEICPPGSDEDPGQIAAGLLHLIGDEEALPDVDPQRGRLEARRSLHALVAGLAGRQPVVLSFSELHWADDVVLDLLGWYLGRLAGLPVAMLVTARPELMERWSPPHGHHNLVTMALDPLDEDSCRQLALALSEGSLSPAVTDALVARSGGNPFFLEELLTFVGESAGLETATTGRVGELPVTLRGLVAARLDSLPLDQRSVLDDAAVIGRSGSFDALAALGAQRDVDDVAAAVTGLLERDLLASADGRWEFRSEVVREVVYETLTKAERARRHWYLARWLSDVAVRLGRGDEILERLAHHYATAAELVRDIGPVPPVAPDVADKAVIVIGKAARWASRRELPLTAVRLLERGLSLAAPGSEARCRLLLDRAMERATLRDLAGAREDLFEVFPGAEGAVRAQAMTVLGVVQQFEEDLVSSADTLSQAVAAWRAIGDRAGEGEALRRYGMTAFLARQTKEAEEAFSEALALARDLANRRDEAWALWHLAEVSFQEGDIETSERRLHEADKAFQDAGDPGGQGWVRGLLAYAKLVQGRRREAETLAVSILEQIRDRGDRWASGMVLVLLASVRLWEGEAAAAMAPAYEALEEFTEINDTQGQLRATSILSRALAAMGRADEAWVVLDQTVARTGAEPTAVRAELAVASVATHVGDWERALAASEEPSGLMASEETVTRGMALVQAGRAAEAVELLEECLPSIGTGQEKVPAGVAPNGWATLGLARLAVGRVEDTLAAVERVVDAGEVATYRDRALGFMAQALAEGRLGRVEAADEAIGSARAQVRGSDDRVTTEVVEMTAGLLGTILGREAGPAAVEASRARLDGLGARSEGWERALEAAAGVAKA